MCGYIILFSLFNDMEVVSLLVCLVVSQINMMMIMCQNCIVLGGFTGIDPIGQVQLVPSSFQTSKSGDKAFITRLRLTDKWQCLSLFPHEVICDL